MRSESGARSAKRRRDRKANGEPDSRAIASALAEVVLPYVDDEVIEAVISVLVREGYARDVTEAALAAVTERLSAAVFGLGRTPEDCPNRMPEARAPAPSTHDPSRKADHSRFPAAPGLPAFQRRGTAAAILACLKVGEARYTEIVARTGRAAGTVSAELSRLVSLGVVSRLDVGGYAIRQDVASTEAPVTGPEAEARIIAFVERLPVGEVLSVAEMASRTGVERRMVSEVVWAACAKGRMVRVGRARYAKPGHGGVLRGRRVASEALLVAMASDEREWTGAELAALAGWDGFRNGLATLMKNGRVTRVRKGRFRLLEPGRADALRLVEAWPSEGASPTDAR